MQRVEQEDADGCGVAVLAMLTDRTWAEVNGDLPHRLTREKQSLEPYEMLGYLWDRGWFLRRVCSRNVTGGVWPPRPFAPTHYAMVKSPTTHGGHWVAMDADGAVLDPFREGTYTLDFYGAVHEVIGGFPDAG